MSLQSPQFSIITPSLNQAAFLPALSASVLGQQGVSLQWIVIDGGSTDGSIEYFHQLDDARVRFTSEPDTGQSNALNKGIARASGDFIGWLNSDDVYAPGALASVAQAFDANPDKRWLVGRCNIIDARGAGIRKWLTAYKNHRLDNYRYDRLLMENTISQPAVFFRRSFAQSVGPLDEGLHFTMDYDLWLRMGKVQAPLILRQTLASFRVHGSSKTGRDKRRQFEEDFRVACRYIGARRWLRFRKRLQVEKIVWAYRILRLFGK